jgi:hypothetical protein
MKFTAASALQQGGMIPLYVPLNQGTEAIIGWVLAGAGPEPWLGTLFWAKSDAESVSLRFTSTE